MGNSAAKGNYWFSLLYTVLISFSTPLKEKCPASGPHISYSQLLEVATARMVGLICGDRNSLDTKKLLALDPTYRQIVAPTINGKILDVIVRFPISFLLFQWILLNIVSLVIIH